MSRLWYKQPAAVWEEALPLGNGRMGAMIFGTLKTEHIQLNEDSVWYGGPIDRNNPDALKNLPEIRRLILEGRIKEAEERMVYAMSGIPQSQRTYQSLGDLYLNFKGMENEEKVYEGEDDERLEYERSLSLDDAVYRMKAMTGAVTYQREAFLSAADEVLAVRLTASEGGSISFSALMTRERFYDTVRKVSEDTIYLEGNLGKGGLDFGMMLKAIPEGGSCEVIGEHLLVKDADAVTLLFTAGTTFRLEKVAEQLEELLSKASVYTYEQLKERHKKDYQQLYDRVTFALAGVASCNELPTDERLKRLKQGEAEEGIYPLFFDYGRYLLISSSRPGTLPANLQGIWNDQMKPAWDSKYTININTEMNYWPAEACNLSECHLPLFDLIKRMLPNGKITAEKMYGCRGFVAHHNTDIWGDTAVQDHWIPGSYWVMGAAWLCTHLWMHYEYTGDIAFLKEAFPMIQEAVLFFLDFLIEDQGYLKTCPTVSPENSYLLPGGAGGCVTIGATMDNQILRDLFGQYLQAAELLGVEDELGEQIRDARSRLVPTQIGAKGNILEWPEDYEEPEPGHRHISHLYGLHPSSQINMIDTPELTVAARHTLERRLENGGGHTGWSRAWIINFYARLWDGENAHQNLEQLLQKSTLPNLFDNHPPFQIDGNFGATAGVVEMLVQSTMDRIVLLPALPKAWPEGSIQGICVRGGAELDLTWKAGMLKQCSIRAKREFRTEVFYHGNSVKVDLTPGESFECNEI